MQTQDRPPQDVPLPAVGRQVPYLYTQVLRRCANCHTPHPLARRPPADPATCPDCGAPAEPPGPVVHHEAKGGLWLWLANLCNGVARWLIQMSERL